MDLTDQWPETLGVVCPGRARAGRQLRLCRRTRCARTNDKNKASVVRLVRDRIRLVSAQRHHRAAHAGKRKHDWQDQRKLTGREWRSSPGQVDAVTCVMGHAAAARALRRATTVW
jgi:hypothetical protein